MVLKGELDEMIEDITSEDKWNKIDYREFFYGIYPIYCRCYLGNK